MRLKPEGVSQCGRAAHRLHPGFGGGARCARLFCRERRGSAGIAAPRSPYPRYKPRTGHRAGDRLFQLRALLAGLRSRRRGGASRGHRHHGVGPARRRAVVGGAFRL